MAKTTKTIKTPVAEVQEPSISLGDKTFSIASLPQEVQDLIGIYQAWGDELKKQQIETFKIQAAMKGISIEIEQRLASVAAK